MTPKVKNTAIVLGGAVALSSAAYALGSQSGSGDAQAVTSSSPRTANVSTANTQARPTFRRGGFGRGRGFGPALARIRRGGRWAGSACWSRPPRRYAGSSS